MARLSAISVVLIAGLAACDAWETAPPPAPPPPAPIAETAPPSFEDNGIRFVSGENVSSLATA